MPVASIGGIELYYEDTGAVGPAEAGKPAVVFLHGAAGNALSWWQQVPAFSERFRCVTYDSRGFYRSPDVTSKGISRIIDDLEALLDHLGISRVSLVAQSMGGRAAIAFAARHPERTAALVMSNTWGQFDWPEQWQLAEQLGAAGLGDVQVGPIRGLSFAFQEQNKELTYLFRQISGCNRAPTPELRGAQPGGPSIDEVRALSTPLLCITGAEDVVIPPQLVQRLAEAVRGAECVVFAGAGHSAYFELPARWNEAVLAFLGKHP